MLQVEGVSDREVIRQIGLLGLSHMNLGPRHSQGLVAKSHLVMVSARITEAHHPKDERARRVPGDGLGSVGRRERPELLGLSTIAPLSSLTKKKPNDWLLDSVSSVGKLVTSAGTALRRK